MTLLAKFIFYAHGYYTVGKQLEIWPESHGMLQMANGKHLTVAMPSAPKTLQDVSDEEMTSDQRTGEILAQSLHKIIQNHSRTEVLPDSAALQSMLTIAGGIQTEAFRLKTNAQTRIDTAEAELQLCNTDANLKTCCIPLETVVDAERLAHSICRDEQATAKLTMQASCSNASTLADAALAAVSTAAAATCTTVSALADAATIQGFINTVSAAVSAHKPALDEAVTACAADTATLGDANAGKVHECNSKQVAFEIAFCQLKTALEFECATLAACHSHALALAEAEDQQTKVDEAHFKSLWSVGESIQCLVELVTAASSTPRTNISSPQVAACANQTAPSNLTVQYPNLTNWATPESCHAADEALFPDEADFYAKEYTNDSHVYAADVHTCETVTIVEPLPPTTAAPTAPTTTTDDGTTFVRGTSGSNVCPAGSCRIASLGECQEAMRFYGYSVFGEEENHPNYPRGCYVLVEHPKLPDEVWWNTHETGAVPAGDVRTQLFCKEDCGSTPATAALVTAEASVGTQWLTISETSGCSTNTEGITWTANARYDPSGDYYTLASCKAACTGTCQAIDYYTVSKWCMHYDTPCTTPTAIAGGGPTSYRKV